MEKTDAHERYLSSANRNLLARHGVSVFGGGAPASESALGKPLSRREALRLAAWSLGACALPAFALTGCGYTDDDRQAVRDSLDSELTQLTTLSADELLGDARSDIEKLGISGDDFLDAYFDGCSWSTGDVSFDGGVATASVALSCRSLSSALDALKEAYTSQTLEDGGHPDESSLYATAGKALLDCLHATALGTRDVDVTLTKQNGSWLIDDAGRSSLISAILGS